MSVRQNLKEIYPESSIIPNLVSFPRLHKTVNCSVVSDSLGPPWAIAHHATLFIEFPRQEYWNGLPFPSLRDLSDLGIETESPSLQADSLLSEPPGKPLIPHIYHLLSAICYLTSGRYLAPPDLHPYLTNGHNDINSADLPKLFLGSHE